MEKMADALKNIGRRLCFKQREELAFLFANVALKEISELCNLGGETLGIRMFEASCKLLHIPVVLEKIVDLDGCRRNMLPDQRE